jgi:DNA recombination protein RmuC
LAMNQNQEIFTHALNRKIVLITPTTLVATLKVVRLLWQKENQVKNVEEIFKQCGALYDKFVDFIGDMDRIEEALNGAGAAYRDALYKLKTGERKGYTIMGRFEAIRKLEARVSKLIPARHLTDLDLPEDNLDEKMDDSSDGAVAGAIGEQHPAT